MARSAMRQSPSNRLLSSQMIGVRPATGSRKSAKVGEAARPGAAVIAASSRDLGRAQGRERALGVGQPVERVVMKDKRSPSALICRSHSMAKPPRDRGLGRPKRVLDHAARCVVQAAVGDRTLGQPGRSVDRRQKRDLEHRLDLGQRIERQMRDANGRSRMAAAVAEDVDHEIRRAIHRLRQRLEARGDVEEAAEPDHPDDFIEVAERRMRLGDEVDRAALRRLARSVDGGIGPRACPCDARPAFRRGPAAAGRRRAARRHPPVGRRGRNWRPALRTSAARRRVRRGVWRFRSWMCNSFWLRVAMVYDDPPARCGPTAGTLPLPPRSPATCFCRSSRLGSRQRECAAGRAGRRLQIGKAAMGSFSIWHWMLFVAVALLLFGGKGKISDIMGDVAKGVKSFKKGMADDDEETSPTSPSAPRTIENCVGVDANDVHKVG